MKFLLLLDTFLLALVAFVDWLFPELRARARDSLETWWLSFVDLDYRRTGPAIAGRISSRLDRELGSSLTSWRFITSATIFSVVTFVMLFLWIGLAWGVVPLGWDGGIAVLHELMRRVGGALLPIVMIDIIFDVISMVITRHVLRAASDAKTPRRYLMLVGIDTLIAVALALISTLFYGNFYFAPDFSSAMLLFIAYLSLTASGLATCGLLLGGFSSIFARGRSGLVTRKEGWEMLGMALVSSIPLLLTARHNFYLAYVHVDAHDVTMVFFVAAAATAVVPTLLNIVLNIILYIISYLFTARGRSNRQTTSRAARSWRRR